MATSVKTIFEVAEERAILRKARLTVLRGKWYGVATDFLADITELPQQEVEKLLIGYDQVYQMWQKKDFENKSLPHLSTAEVNYLLELFDKKR